MAVSPGRLEVIATPIGNLADLSARAQASLSGANLVAAEDTRRTGQLLASCGISARVISLHEHNEAGRIGPLVVQMQNGAVIALVSDAGTPLISDPGVLLVQAAIAAGIAVVTIPGPSACLAALSISGLDASRFVFEGFLPARGGERRTALGALSAETRTLIFYEAPHRLAETLEDMALVFGVKRSAVIARELTKMHESVYRGTLAQLRTMLTLDENMARGEIVLLVAGEIATGETGDWPLLQRVLPLLLKDLPPARSAAIAAKLSGVDRDTVYREALKYSETR